MVAQWLSTLMSVVVVSCSLVARSMLSLSGLGSLAAQVRLVAESEMPKVGWMSMVLQTDSPARIAVASAL